MSQADYFSIFGLPRKLTIDAAELEKEFYRLSRKLHPDLHARAAAEEQADVLAQSSRLNDAYRTLRHPVSRTEYLLGLIGARISENDVGRKSDAPRVPAELLEEVFELNMQLEEMRANRRLGEDDPVLRAELLRARETFAAQMVGMDEELAAQGRAWDALLDAGNADGRERMVAELSGLLDKRSYLRNLTREVNGTLGDETLGSDTLGNDRLGNA